MELGPDLLGRAGGVVLGRMPAPRVEGRPPALPRDAEVCQPLGVPLGADRLAGGLARRVGVVAALGASLGVAARPDAQVDGRDRLTAGPRVLRHQGAEGRHVPPAVGEGRVDAAPATAMGRSQPQVGQ